MRYSPNAAKVNEKQVLEHNEAPVCGHREDRVGEDVGQDHAQVIRGEKRRIEGRYVENEE
jgi:hypothetical protein